MKTHDFIRANIGNKVYITGCGDLGMIGELRGFIRNKTPLTLIKLTRKGYAYLLDDNGEYHNVPPRNVREVGTVYDRPPKDVTLNFIFMDKPTKGWMYNNNKPKDV